MALGDEMITVAVNQKKKKRGEDAGMRNLSLRRLSVLYSEMGRCLVSM